MSSLIAEPIFDEWVEVDDGEEGDDLIHTSCDCSPNTSLCGIVFETFDGWAENVDTEDDCVVCVDLVPLPCVRCGE